MAEHSTIERDFPHDYDIGIEDAKQLMGVSATPAEFRRKILRQYAANHGREQLIALFAEFVGLANSVVKNTREFVELYLTVECDHYPHTAEKINLPTIFGALQGIEIALSAKGMCHGCAYRKGSVANQSPITSSDAKWTAETDDEFMCHERLDRKGEPTKKCAGYVAARKSVLAGESLEK